MKSMINAVLVLAIALTMTTGATASEWGGHNGTIKLSFSDSAMVHVLNNAEAIPNVGYLVDVYAVLTDLAPLRYNNERILTLGGIELKLDVQGCEWDVITRQFPVPVMNLSDTRDHCITGYRQSLSLKSGSTELVHWQVKLPADAENVSFHLDPAGMMSCNQMSACADSGSQALWAGSYDANQLGLIFSAGYVPAYFNYTDGEPDLTPVRGTGDWSETGLFTTD
jgi:hypothetical protein